MSLQTEHEIDLNEVLFYASKKGNLKVVKDVIASGVDPNAKEGLAIVLASENGHFNVVKYLVNNGALFQMNALFLAETNFHEEIGEFLTETNFRQNKGS